MINDYSELLSFRKYLFRTFDEDQEVTAGIIANAVCKHVDAGIIHTIVDLGCGTGEILDTLSKRLKCGSNCEQLRYFGIDCCAAEIKKAKQLRSHCTFIHANAEEVANLFELKDVKWDKALLLCIGHTLPHFVDLATFLSVTLKDLRPAFILVDFYQKWDSVVESLARHPADDQCEPRALGPGNTVYMLTTRSSEREGRALRGIQEVKNQEIVDTKFWTEQALEKSEWFTSRLEQANYIPEQELEYPSGYGLMRGILFSRPSDLAMVVNAVYYEVISKAVATIFSKQSIVGAMKPFSTRVAAAIFPFDAHHTFARYLSICEGVTAPTDLMYVGKPENIQTRYPTAFGLYMALLNQVSSGTVIPLTELEGVFACSVDTQFAQGPERKFFEESSTGQTSSSSASSETEIIPNTAPKRSFFVVPLYVADLPVACLIVNLSDVFPFSTTDQAVYVQILQNVARLVRQELLISFEREVLRPFVERAVSKLSSEHNLSPDEAIQKLAQLRDNAQNKKWKSWLLTIPSRRIKDLEIVKDDRQLLDGKEADGNDGMWYRAKRAALSEIIVRISDWFRWGSFFCGAQEHEHYEPQVHLPKLDRMLKHAGVKEPPELVTAMFFGNDARQSKELQWVSQQIISLYADRDSEKDESEDVFQDLKCVLCRTWENEGEEFRFTLRRIMCLCSIYHPGVTIIRQTTNLHGNLKITNDKTIQIANLMKSLLEKSIEQLHFTETIQPKLADGSETQTFAIKVTMRDKFYAGGGEGRTNKYVVRAFNDLGCKTLCDFKNMTLRFSIIGSRGGGAKLIEARWKTTDEGNFVTFEFTP